MNSIFLKNFSLLALLVALSFTLLGASFITLGRSFAVDTRKDSILLNAETMSRTAAAFLEYDNLDSWDFKIILSTVSDSTGNVIFITSTNGTVVNFAPREGLAINEGTVLEPKLMESVISQTLSGGSFGFENTSGGGSYYFVAAPVIVAGTTIMAYTFVGSDFTDIVATWGNTSQLFILLAVSVLLIAIVLSFYASRRQAEPINEIAAAARKFAYGDFSARVTPRRSEDEIAALADSFNSMAESLEKSEQLRSEFIANVSHELKTPMTTIGGFADGILDGTIPKAEQDKYLEVISSETKRLSRMVRQMLHMSRIQNVDTPSLLAGSFDIAEVVVRTLLAFENKITSGGLDVDARLPEERILVRGDEDSLTQVFYNLLDNAVKFAEKGSVITVSLWKQDGRAYVAVENRGQTIDPEELPFIFDRFRKLDKSRSRDRDGVGLGLSIAKTILNNHNEDVSVTSRDGVTRFVFTVKLKEKEKESKKG
ncbi:MAG: HAMP domain-containing histidine kinase [Oscillospiraceae bacterium]|jgi:signal transduction histidine kinase|nr:HAMP domain-containing histidine kinase [Oscillospiraceae bacterium]